MTSLRPDSTQAARGPDLRSLVELVPDLLSDDPVEVAATLQDRYGYVVRIPPFHPAIDADAYLVTHPDDVRFVLQTDPAKFRSLDTPGTRDFTRVVTDSIVSLTPESDGDAWMQRTRMLSPEFGEHAVAEHVPTLAQTTLTALAELSDGRMADGDPATVPESARVWTPDADGVRLLPAMRRLGLRLLGVSLFGSDVRAHEVEVVDAVDTLRTRFKRRQFGLVTSRVRRHLPDELHLPAWLQESLGADPHVELPRPEKRRTAEAIRTLGAVADDIVTRREQTPLVFDDGLGRWLLRPDPVSGETLSPESLRQEVVGLLIAGHATTSAGLTWAFYLLAGHPETQERIHEEARDTTLLALLEDLAADGGDPPSTIDVPGFLDDLDYTRRVWQETLRLYPSLPMFGRTAAEPVTIRGTPLDEGANVLLGPYVTHRLEEFWDAPERFDPGRFTEERRVDRPEMAYFPFSAGPHACLGRAIATTEATVVLATTLATHRVEFAGPDAEGPHDGPAVGVDSAINLQPDREITLQFVPRG